MSELYKESKNSVTSLDFEILNVINALNSFKILHKMMFLITIKTDCKTIEKFFQKK